MPKILVVDDSSVMRKMIENALVEIGLNEIETAADGLDALIRVDETFDLILTDWNMPKVSGLSFVKNIQSNPKLAKIPIIMVTTEAARTEVLDAIKAGVTDYIVKPFEKKHLIAKVMSVLNSHKAPDSSTGIS